MAATGLYMNWVNVSVTPGSGSAINIDGVTGIGVGRSNRQEVFYGDALAFARLIKAVEKKRSITIQSGAVRSLLSIPDDTLCTVSATLSDPRNGTAAAGGGFTIVLTGAVLEKDQSEGPNNKVASGNVTFNCQGSIVSGSEVDPLTITPL